MALASSEGGGRLTCCPEGQVHGEGQGVAQGVVRKGVMLSESIK